MNQYLSSLSLPSENTEIDFLWSIMETDKPGHYPFKIFPQKELSRIDFTPLTILYGGNGSGKTTLLQVLAELLKAERSSPFAGGPFFADYQRFCRIRQQRQPAETRIITSDDVFDHLLDLRGLNNGIDARREELFKEYADRKYQSHRLTSLDDYDDWKQSYEAKRKTRSAFTNDRLRQNHALHSNGESALHYFVERIRENALYLLDEPENSLSIALQKELAAFLSDSVRYFGCQLVIATHSPVLLAMPNARIYDLDAAPARARAWTELENVRQWYAFFKEHRTEFSEEN